MPIRPSQKDRYPADWKVIREEILRRAGDRCEFCGVPNGAIIRRSKKTPSVWRPTFDDPVRDLGVLHLGGDLGEVFDRPTRVVLTIAHLNQTPEDVRRTNLRALCQRCHNLVDLPWRTVHAAETRAIRDEGRTDGSPQEPLLANGAGSSCALVEKTPSQDGPSPRAASWLTMAHGASKAVRP